MKTGFFATISEESPRYKDWLQIMEAPTLPIESPYPHLASAPGIAVAQFYKLSVERLSRDQKERLIQHLASRFQIASEIVRRDIAAGKCVPILADDVSVRLEGMAFL